MARLQDVAVVFRTVGPWGFCKRVWGEILDDHLFIFSAALAYAWLFAIFPLFIFLIHLIPFLPGDRVSHEETRAQLDYFLHASLPEQAADVLWENMDEQIEKALTRQRGGVLSVSLLLTLWAASGGITVTMAALDKCYEIDRPRVYYKRRPMAFALTAAVCLLIAAVILLLPVGSMLRNWLLWRRLDEVSYWALFVFDVLRGGLALAAAFLVLALIYHFGPSVKHRWEFVTPGSVFCIVTWITLGAALNFYASHYGGRYDRTYGTVGGVILLLLVFYLDAVVLLVGAQINSEIDFEVHGVPRGQRDFRQHQRKNTKRRGRASTG